MVADSELRNLVDEFLYLIEVGSGSTPADEAELAHLLDRLALAMRTLVAPAVPERPLDVPARNFDVLRKVVGSRFPNYGSYACAAPLSVDRGSVTGAEPELVVANAIDDVAVIADDLHAVAWLWRSASSSTGLWYLEESHSTRWGRPLRTLQLYLHDRGKAAGTRPDSA